MDLLREELVSSGWSSFYVVELPYNLHLCSQNESNLPEFGKSKSISVLRGLDVHVGGGHLQAHLPLWQVHVSDSSSPPGNLESKPPGPGSPASSRDHGLLVSYGKVSLSYQTLESSSK